MNRKTIWLCALTLTGMCPACAEDDSNEPIEMSVEDVLGEEDAGSEGASETGSTDGDMPATGEASAPVGDAEVFNVSGDIIRTAMLGPGGDGIGTLCVAITHSCPSMSNLNPERIGDPGARVEGADMSEQGAVIPYSIPVDKAEAEIGKSYAVSAFLREDGSPCVPAPGDPIARAGDIVATFCGFFEYTGGDAENVDVTLDWALQTDI